MRDTFVHSVAYGTFLKVMVACETFLQVVVASESFLKISVASQTFTDYYSKISLLRYRLFGRAYCNTNDIVISSVTCRVNKQQKEELDA